MSETIIAPNFKVCKFDETSNWREDIAKRAGKIYGVYFYDASRQTRCCEITPSYELHFIGSVIEGELDSEDEVWKDKLYNDIQEGDNFAELASYKHCHVIDALSKDDNKDCFGDHVHDEETYADEESYKELFEECIDDERCNPTF